MSHSDSQHIQHGRDGIRDTIISISDQGLTEQSGHQRTLDDGRTLTADHTSRSTPGREQVDKTNAHVASSSRDDGGNLHGDELKSQDFEKEDWKINNKKGSELNRAGKASTESVLKRDGDLLESADRNGSSKKHGSFIEQEPILNIPFIDDNSSDASLKSSDTILSDDNRHTKEEVLEDTEKSSIQHSSKDNTTHQNRLVKRGSTNWKRIKNTLKVASEMQGIKKQKHALDREDSFLKKFSTRNHQDINNISNVTDEENLRSSESCTKYEGFLVIHHDGTFMFSWLGIMTLAVLYNVWTCIARQAFTEIQQGCPACWYTFDGVFDLIYVCDIFVQFRTGYLDQGLMVYNARKLCKKYTRSKVIYLDFLCLLPLDLLQFVIGVHPMIRFPRFLKVYRTFRFVYMLESRTSFPNLFRVANLTHLVLLGAHWFAAFYYMISAAEKFKGGWAYPQPIGEFAHISRKYLQSFFWATMTLTTIGDLPHPSNSNQFVFVIVSYLIGVFVFATIVGQVGNVINNRNASRIEFERLLDGAKVYMQTHNVPHNLQKRVQRWYDYVWSRGRLNGCDINSLGLLPDKLKTELAIHVNLETLRKVTIFQECQPEFLHDLVLKMKAYIFTPGDLICRRGEVAREMFIIADGVVEIISETGVMLKRMGAGDFFGEIGILNLDAGINRRSADARSVGYLELFVLSKEDVLAALKDHPEAEVIIREYGQRRLREVEAHRHKVKPLKNEGLEEQQVNSSGEPQTVQNRLLKTLKTLNSVVRRQSAQVNNNQMSPPAGSPSDVQRLVPGRDSPVSKLNLVNSNSDMRSGLAIVSSDTHDYSTGFLANIFSQNSTQKRKKCGYLQTAYVKFRNVIHRGKGKRRRMDISDSPRRKYTENRLLLKPVDEHSVTVDLNARSLAFKPECHVTVNIEDCSGSNQIMDDTGKTHEDGRNNNKNDRCSQLETGSLLFLGGPERRRSACGQNVEKNVQRKLSNPISYTPVSTEDVDGKCHINHKDSIHEATEIRPQIILDVGKIGKVWESVKMWESIKGNAFSDTYSSYHEPSKCNSSQIHNSKSQVLALEDTPLLSNDVYGHACSVNTSLANSFKTTDPQSQNVCLKSQSGPTTGKCQHDSIINIDMDSSESFRAPPLHSFPSTSFGSSPKGKAVAKSALPHRPPEDCSSPERFQRTLNSDASDALRHHEDCDIHLGIAFIDEPEHATVHSPSCSIITPSCPHDPADSAQTTTVSHLSHPDTHRLINVTPVAATQVRSVSASKNLITTKVRSLSNGDDQEQTTTLSPYRTFHSERSLSAASSSECLSDVQNSHTLTSRQSIYEQNEYLTPDLFPGNMESPTLKLQPDVATPVHRSDSSSGRSQPMSIIQQLTSDVAYQQLATEINAMQGMIDKRLTLLEEAFMSTSAQLDKLAASQDALVHLLTQNTDGRQRSQPTVERKGDQDVVYRL